MLKSAPFIPVKEVVLPGVITTVFVGREKSVRSLEVSLLSNNKLILFLQKDNEEDSPLLPDGIYPTGVLVNIVQSTNLPDGIVRVLLESEKRVELSDIIERDDFYKAEYKDVELEEQFGSEEEALKRKILDSFESYLRVTNKISPELMVSIRSIRSVHKLLDLIASNVGINVDQKQDLLETIDPRQRGLKILGIIEEELEVIDIERRIDNKVKDQMTSVQRNYYLKEKIKAIREELGEDSTLDEIDDVRDDIELAKIPKMIKERLVNEANKLAKMPAYSSEFAVVRNYIETVLELPWKKSTKDILDIKHAEKILEKQHYGLKEVKERILEFLAVKQLNKNLSGSILCLAGPPGVGKSSLVKSIAESLGRKFARISLGGVKDESEIRGHRRTYVGAMPGRIIKEMKHVNSNNPVLLLDEIDKMSNDYKGDPSSAMLEVLDPEQNKEFIDNYLDMPFDLSKIFFVATANDIYAIPDALRDRMEVIQLSSYTEIEKLYIAKLYLIAKSQSENGLKKLKITFTDKAISKIINEYTREAGVRQLKRTIDKLFRKIAKKSLEKTIEQVTVNEAKVQKLLGNPKFLKDKQKKKEGKVGVVNGLAWSTVGGSTLEVQSTVMAGKGKLIPTGKLGDVMKESTQVAQSYIRSISKKVNLNEADICKKDLHIHFPEGATPKDGPSAGIAVTTSMISALSGRKVRQDIAMTGEITITGEVLPVGGIKEKIIGAHRAGIREVILPLDNKYDVSELPKEIKKDMKIYFAERYEEVMERAFEK